MPMQTRASALRGPAAGSRVKQGDSGIAERRWEQPRSKSRIRLSTKRPAANPVVLCAEDSLVDGVDAPSSSTKNRKTGVKKMKNGKAASPPAVVNDALREKGMKIAQQLAGLYPQPPIPLKHGNKFELLVAVMLSAQTTDKKVNEVSPTLFKLAPTPKAMGALDVETIQEVIRTIGLAPTKAKNLSKLSKILEEQHNGDVPNTFEALESLPGVGHKTASVVMVQGFGRPAFPVDTHIHRLAERWGLSNGKSVEQTEADLKAIYPESMWRDLHLQIIYFGREHCPAKNHDASKCPICSWAAVTTRRPMVEAGKPRPKNSKK